MDLLVVRKWTYGAQSAKMDCLKRGQGVKGQGTGDRGQGTGDRGLRGAHYGVVWVSCRCHFRNDGVDRIIGGYKPINTT